MYADESSQVGEQLVICTEKISSKKKAKNLYVEDHEQNANIFSDASGLNRSKKRVKESSVEAKIEVNTELVNEKEKPSIKNKEVSGTLIHSFFYPNNAVCHLYLFLQVLSLSMASHTSSQSSP